MSLTKSVSVSITERRVVHCAHLIPGLYRKQTFSEDTWYLFPLQMFEEKQTPEWDGRGFLSAGLYDVKQGASGPHRSAELTIKERGRDTI